MMEKQPVLFRTTLLYLMIPYDTTLQVLAPPDSDNEHSISDNIPIPDANPTPAPFIYPIHLLPTIPIPTLVTSISTVTPDQVLIGPCHQRDQTPRGDVSTL